MVLQSFDVVICGGGLAGLQAAVSAAETAPNSRIAILTLASEKEYGGCSFKTHGTNAAMNPDDSVVQHQSDTLKGGGMIGSPALVERMCQEIPAEIRKMELRGVRFDKDGDRYLAGYYGGSTTARSVHSRDMAGKHMVDALTVECRIRGVHVFHCRHVISHIRDSRGVVGVFALNVETNEIEAFGGNVVSAMGGGACVYPIATISQDKLGAGIILGLESGAVVSDMEMVQFHPTGLNRPGCPGHGEILEEELRSMGAQFYNSKGERYMFDYDSRGERATRDIVARGSYMEILSGRGTPDGAVFLDTSCIDHGLMLERFPYMVQRLRSFGTDLLTAGRITTSPAAHFLMGGLLIDRNGKTSIDGLFACGEDAGGIHGGNRLGGNGVADALVFGAAAGSSAASAAHRSIDNAGMIQNSYTVVVSGLSAGRQVEMKKRIESLMWRCAGPVRNGRELRQARVELQSMLDEAENAGRRVRVSNFRRAHLPGHGVVQRLRLSLLIVQAALARGNSVGAHFRTDADDEPHIYNTIVRIDPEGAFEVGRRYRGGTMEGSLAPAEAA